MANKTATVSAALEHIRELLDHDHADEALNFITHLNNDSPEMANARGVCLLRLRRFDEAIQVLRDLTCQGAAGLSHEAPALFRANFAAALLRANRDKGGALEIANALTGDEHAEAARLKAAVRRWKEGLGFLGRLRCGLGLYPPQPVPLDERAGAV